MEKTFNSLQSELLKTIADIEGSADIRKQHLLEAISYRSLDRSTWVG